MRFAKTTLLTAVMGLAAMTSGVMAQHAAPEPTKPSAAAFHEPAAVIQAFAAAVSRSDSFTPTDKKFTADAIAADAGNADKQPGLIPACLARLYPDFGQAMTLLAQDQIESEIKTLDPLRSHADPYLAAHAAFYQARALAGLDRFEEALPILRGLVDNAADKTNYTSEAFFWIGVCQAGTLHRGEAIQTLQSFIDKYPSAPERLRMTAQQMVTDLSAIRDDSLDEAGHIMGGVVGRLKNARTDQPTQDLEVRIIKILDKLIKEAEDRENSGGGGGGGGTPPPGGGSSPGGPNATHPGSSPAGDSAIVPGAGAVGPLNPANPSDTARAWNSPDKRAIRAKALESLKGRIPSREYDLAVKYFKQVNGDTNLLPR